MTKSSHNFILHLLPESIALLCLVMVGCPGTEQLLFTEGEDQLKQQHYAAAYDTFTRFIAQAPKSSSGYYNRALACMGLDRFSQALDDLDVAARLNPEDTDAHWMRFKIQAEQREAVREDTVAYSFQRPMKVSLESALTVFMMEELNAILKIDGADARALNERGRLKHERGDYEAALVDYDAALTLCDTCTWLMYNKALTLRASWRTREALAVLETLVEADSLDGEAWLLFGECNFGLGRREKACEAFRRSMQLGVSEAEERFNTLCR